MATTWRLNRANVRTLLYGRSGPVYQAVNRAARDTQLFAKQFAPIDKGPLRSSIRATVTVNEAAGKLAAWIGSDLFYAIYQERGTGIYGPRGTPIVPRTAPFLVFKPKGSNKFVRARSVRGAPAVHYLVRGLERGSPWPVVHNV